MYPEDIQISTQKRKPKAIRGAYTNDFGFCVKRSAEVIRIAHKRYSDMIKRVDTETAYQNVTICEEWKVMSNFVEWFVNNYKPEYKGFSMDKDLYSPPNPENRKIYSPETVCFIPQWINSAIPNIKKSHGVASKRRANGSIVYEATCKFNGTRECIGTFKNKEDAVIAVCLRKKELFNNIRPELENIKVGLTDRILFVLDWEIAHIKNKKGQ